MNNFGEQINLIINNLSQKLGVASDKLYLALRKQAFIDGVTDLIWILLAFTIMFGMYKIIKSWIKKYKEDESYELLYNDDLAIPKIICLIIGSIFSVLLLSFNIHSALTALYNPDYYIIQQITSLIKQ